MIFFSVSLFLETSTQYRVSRDSFMTFSHDFGRMAPMASVMTYDISLMTLIFSLYPIG